MAPRIHQLSRLQVADPVLQRWIDQRIAVVNPALRELAMWARTEPVRGATNGTNAKFFLRYDPDPDGLSLFVNGVYQHDTRFFDSAGNFTISGRAILFNSGSIPPAGATVAATYPHR